MSRCFVLLQLVTPKTPAPSVHIAVHLYIYRGVTDHDTHAISVTGASHTGHLHTHTHTHTRTHATADKGQASNSAPR